MTRPFSQSAALGVFLMLLALGMNSHAGDKKSSKEKPQPVKLDIENDALQARPGQVNDICKVKVYRQGQLGALTITVPNLPKGVTLDKTVIPEGKDTAVLKFRVASNAPPTASTRSYSVFAKGKGMEGSAMITFAVLGK